MFYRIFSVAGFCLALLSFASSDHAWPADYPERPVRVLVGYAAGGPGDTLARLVCQALTERLHQPFIVDDRPGAASNLAADIALKSSPDGYTLLLATAANAINSTLYTNLDFDFAHDFTPIATLSREPLVMTASLSVPAKTVPEFIAYAKAHPGKVTMASAGNGTASHVSGELFSMLTGIKMIHVPYRGASPALTDLLGGRIDVYFSPMSGVIDLIRANKILALATTTKGRTAALPQVPSLDEFVPNYESSQWYGLVAPKGTKKQVVEKLSKEINRTLGSASFKQRLDDLGETTFPGSSTAFGEWIASETDKWGKVVKFSGVTPD